MISKAKIFFYGMFRRPKVTVTKTKKLNFLNKLMLIQVRRFKRFRDIPTTLSLFDWQESKHRAWKHYKFLGYCLLLYVAFDIIWFFKYRRLMIAEKLHEERRKKNLPERPLYNIYGENPEYDAYSTDFLFRNVEAHRREKP